MKNLSSYGHFLLIQYYNLQEKLRVPPINIKQHKYNEDHT